MENINCPNCGGSLKFKANSYSQLCDYCGSKFKLEDKSDKLIAQTTLLPFKIEKKQFKKEAINWLITGNYIHADILSRSKFSSIKKCYVPIYLFKGTCTGSWTGFLKPDIAGINKFIPAIFKGPNKMFGKGSVDEKVNTICQANDYSTANQIFYNGIARITGNSEGPPILSLINRATINEEDLIPADKQEVETNLLCDFDLTEDQAWDVYGGPKTSRDIRHKLAENPDEKEIILEVEYVNDSVSKIYIPFWAQTVYVNNLRYDIYMDGITGTIAGDNVEDLLLKPHKKAISPLAIFIGLLISFMLYLLRFFLPDGKTNLSQHNNILLSPILGFWWYIRIILLWVVLPIYLTKIFYKKKQEAVINKLRNKRQNELNEFNSGKLELNYVVDQVSGYNLNDLPVYE